MLLGLPHRLSAADIDATEDYVGPGYGLISPGGREALDLMARIFSPYDLNPKGANPLSEILAECVDFERVAKAPIKLFVTATGA